ncbi:hypothetical protein [Streptomyces galbus]|uniref:Uncharacterized protein n=1 Tax=Streptomyces galbus TaxID=33898 RepID=A0A4U5X7P9_STRGB|nr:hypothetical protein [Streptomyces galbus]TKT11174.1 hypothetical protein E4U92_01425 [Streptomyces galbus]GHD38482.1 hypothetical protein GCM10010335_37270 [Streptomyces galbus]
MNTPRLRADTARLDLELLVEIAVESLSGKDRPAYLREYVWDYSVAEDECTLVFTLRTGRSAGLQLKTVIKGLGEDDALRLKVDSANEPGGLSLKYLAHLRKEMDNLEYNLRKVDGDVVVYR